MLSPTLKIQTAILSIKVPFCVTSLFWLLAAFGMTDRNLILDILDDLCDRGLVVYQPQNGFLVATS